jgi:Rieske Fe-S protein
MLLCMVHGSRWDACERASVLVTGVIPVSLRPLITISNLGVWSCLDAI